MASKVYRVRVRKGETEVEVEGDRAYVNRVFSELKRLLIPGSESTALQAKTSKTGQGSTSAAKPQSPREFLDLYDLKRHTDIVLAFGYYLEKRQALGAFTGADINKCYYDAKVEPSNTSQMIIQNIRKGYMMEAKGSGQGRTKYTLTQKGEKFVEAGFTSKK